jgi:hypothetical protein
MTAVDAAEQVHGVGEVTRGMRSSGVDQCRNMRMARAATVGYAGKLRFRYAYGLAFDIPVRRHGATRSLRKNSSRALP